MSWSADAGHGVFDEDEFIASIECGTGGGFDAEVGGHSTEEDGADAAAAQLLVEFRPIKRPPLALGNEHVAGLEAALGDDL